MADITPAPSSYTFNGTTVQFSQAQKDILNKDLIRISDEAVKLEGYLNDKAEYDRIYKLNQDRLTVTSGNCVGLPNDEWKDCSDDATNKRNDASAYIGKYNTKIKISSDFLNKDVKNSYVWIYNNDILQIQNNIKIQIQAQQANSATAAANTSNANSQSQNSPASIAQANALSAQLQAQQIAKSLETRKLFFFGFVVVVVLIASVIIVRKLV